MLLENKTDRPFVQRVYRNLRVEGSVSNTVHANLHKIEAYACTPADTAESSFTDLVISRDGSSVRFGELDHVTIKGRVLVSKGPSVQFEQDIGEDLGVHLSTQDSAGVTVYTEKDYLHSHRDKRGILILAPNFIDPQGDVNFAPATSISRPGYTKIKPDRFGGLRNLHVKGSLIIDTFVCLDQSIVPPIGGWYFGDRQHEWYRPPNGVIVPEKQTEFGVARAGDLVISRGNASVLIRGDGSGFMTAGFVALFYLTVSYGGPVDVDSRGRCGNGAEVARKIVIRGAGVFNRVVVKIATNVNINSPTRKGSVRAKGSTDGTRCLRSRRTPGFDYDREYKMLKPKVLFHTWVAIYGSGIFDGTFALPKTGRKLDYVSKIKSNARFLEKQRSRS
ncbi:hypothetical protein Q5P01_016587 [Channa striata]|uniref:Uncharacterized protein n=1 Tax=Channa striata TaxID=64152 RepID=A0AA88M8K3_CHASR|nr:hypothetical protein Q5P01_016587 [Channa striata]